MTRTARLAAMLSACALAGCGGGGETKTVTVSDAPQARPTTTAPPASPQPNADADLKLAAAAQIKLSDLPTGWATDSEEGTLSKCSGIAGARSEASGRTEEPAQFKLSGFEGIAHSVYVMPTEDSAVSTFKALLAPSERRCLADEVEAADSGSEQPNKITAIEDVNVAPLGNESRSYRLTIKTSVVDIDADVVYTRIGRVISTLRLLGASDNTRETMPQVAASQVKSAVEDAE